MGIFSNASDVSGQLRDEGLNVTVKWQPGVPNVGQGTISWNIPGPVQETLDANGNVQVTYSSSGPGLVYGGIVLVLKANEPATMYNIPKDGCMYVADPTANEALFSGDKIADGLVVGAIYESAVKAQGGPLTTSIIVNDVDPDTNYFICGYIHDDQNRYFQEGNRAYSEKFALEQGRGRPARQEVQLRQIPGITTNVPNYPRPPTAPQPTVYGVKSTDGTGLLAGATYQFELIVDSNFPHPNERSVKRMFFNIDGKHTPTFKDLVLYINEQIAIQCTNAVQSPVPPNAGVYYWNSTDQTLSQWDGMQLNLVAATVDSSDPAVPATGSYWWNSTTNQLLMWTGLEYTPVLPEYSSPVDPTTAQSGLYWWTGTAGFSRCGNTWCEADSFDQTTDPSCAVVPISCSYWYDTTNSTLYGWTDNGWAQAYALMWTEAPTALSDGTEWFDLQTNTLSVRQSGAWVSQVAIISTVDPTTVSTYTVIPGTYWYNPTTEVLNVRDSTNTFWTVTPVLVWSSDPSVVGSCELWWDESTTPATLNQWDQIHSTWNAVSAFYQQSTDPYGTPTLTTGTLWWNSNTATLLLWNGSSWSVIPFFNQVKDPALPITGTAWLNTTTNTWSTWSGTTWTPVTALQNATDPSQPLQGSFWYDTTTNALYSRVGTNWIPVPYVTTPPSNFKGSTWYNLATKQLMEWNGEIWAPTLPCAYARLDRGELVFETTGRGSNNCIFIPIPAGVPNNPSTCVTINTGQVDFVNDSNSPYQNYPLGGFGNSYPCSCMFETGSTYGRVNYPALNINPKAFLFSNLNPPGSIPIPVVGQDAVDGTPTYDQLGVGTTGDPAQRRQLMKEVRTLLGNSGNEVITVELDEASLDLCVTNALRVFRQKSSLALKRAAFMLDIQPYKQNYILADKAVGYNKIVAVMAGYRFTAAFLASAMGAGVYGQVVLQHLYNMGTFDLLSYHVVAQYVENLEILFSTRLVFVFNESNRELQLFQAFNRPERILLDVVIEKTEQEIFSNRYANRWIQQYALAEACDMLAQIRGKYSSLPGAGGAVTLNASDLRSQAQDIRTKCQEEIDDYTVQNVEDFGAYGSIAIG